MSLFRRRAAGPLHLRLLSRPGCHLCERMRHVAEPVLAANGGSLTEVDVDSDPALAERWGNEIPVLVDAAGTVLARVRDTDEQIRRRLG